MSESTEAQQTPEATDDVEGHRVSSHVDGGGADSVLARPAEASSSDEDDDVEGHRVSSHVDGGGADSFRVMAAPASSSDEDDDVEGHRMSSHIESQHEQESDRGAAG